MVPGPRFVLPDLLREGRLARGLAQAAVAKSAGVDVTSLCAWERGRRPPPPDDQLHALADCLELEEEDRGRLLRAARHDRLVREASRQGIDDATGLISAAIRANTELDARVQLGLSADIRRQLVIAQQVGAVVRRGKEADMDP
jgi:transcriptional regulator with XRE-family HTH domain